LKHRAVFLDRDGVLINLPPKEPLSSAGMLEEIEIVSDATRALNRLRHSGFLNVVVTNQPDIARGKLDERFVQAAHQLLRSALPIDAIYVCPHDNENGCSCRKPKPGLILQAAAEMKLDLTMCCLIGDRWVDLAAAQAVGVRDILLAGPHSWEPTSLGPPASVEAPRFTARTLTECVDFILS
jgi:D-glycero-D-manno-heptose 1,7-bisphosphate phosphatase